MIDVTTMLRLISEDIDAALREFKLDPKAIPAFVREFERQRSH
jgi:hypothetical protein